MVKATAAPANADVMTEFCPSSYNLHGRAVVELGKLCGQVSVYDTINPEGGYARKVRRLGEFHPALAGGKSGDAQDLDDPLYGNQGGEAELVQAYQSIISEFKIISLIFEDGVVR